MNELKAIEEINEEIKSIVSVAESISLTAVDAMLEAAGTGINVVGFSLVARELQMFREKIATAMQSLSGLIYWQAEVNAGKHHRAQIRDFLTQAHAVPISGQADVDEIEQLIVKQVCELQIRMMRTAKQCETGLLIARSGDTEEAQDAMPPEMQQITQNVEEVVGSIALRIEKLESQLAEAGLWKEQRLFINSSATNEYLLT
ncbi:MAG TPA: hypothetical protein VIF10_09020 [Methylobacter sp.]|jgi:hypothetical protein